MAPGKLPTVSFDPPVAQNGQPPVNVTCAPASGTEFAPGDTTVTCTATDALARTASCSFTVSVTENPQITVSKFLAFGDSLTAGTTSPDPTALLLSVPDSYPFKLQALMAARYIDQPIEVFNEGCAGEFVDGTSPNCPGGIKRLPDMLRQYTPQVVLLMHGANDLRMFEDNGIPDIIGGLEQMIGEAQRAGAMVLVATLPPQNIAGSRGQGADEVPLLNREIAKMAQDEGAVLVDLYGHMGGSYVGYIGADGLHPTPRGYDRIAEIWFDAIRSQFERAPAPPPAPPTVVSKRR